MVSSYWEAECPSLRQEWQRAADLKSRDSWSCHPQALQYKLFLAGGGGGGRFLSSLAYGWRASSAAGSSSSSRPCQFICTMILSNALAFERSFNSSSPCSSTSSSWS